jgi:hypothetical protein
LYTKCLIVCKSKINYFLLVGIFLLSLGLFSVRHNRRAGETHRLSAMRALLARRGLLGAALGFAWLTGVRVEGLPDLLCTINAKSVFSWFLVLFFSHLAVLAAAASPIQLAKGGAAGVGVRKHRTVHKLWDV